MSGASSSKMNPGGLRSDFMLFQSLAQKVHLFEKNQLTKGVIAQANACILDALGTTLAGYPERCTQTLLKVPGIATAPGAALIFGSSRRTSALDAALVNGIASCALDFTDADGNTRVDHSVPLAAMLIALAEERGGTGEDLIVAYVIGVEVETRMARAAISHHDDEGRNQTTTKAGVVGAAAAACHFMKLDDARTTIAMCIAASLASGFEAELRMVTKPLYFGQCCRNGLFAALLAEGGFETTIDALDQQGLNGLNEDSTFDVGKLFDGWGVSWEIDAKSIALKRFPCCTSTHAAIVAALELRQQDNVASANIRHIEVRSHGDRLRHVDRPRPQTPLEAKFSIQYVVARALRSGRLRLRDFETEALLQPKLQRVLDMTAVTAAPDMTDDGDDLETEVVVTLQDGTRLARRARNPGDNRMRSDELWDKFSDYAARSLPREQIAPLFERLETLEKVTEINQVTCLLEVSEMHKMPEKAYVLAPRGAQEPPETTWVP